jgi:DNA-binding CsgD family transcriptional regulator
MSKHEDVQSVVVIQDDAADGGHDGTAVAVDEAAPVEAAPDVAPAADAPAVAPEAPVEAHEVAPDAPEHAARGGMYPSLYDTKATTIVAVLLAWWTGNGIFDSIGSILIGVVLVGVAVFLAREVKSLLIGESADGHIAAAVKATVPEHENIEAVLRLIADGYSSKEIARQLAIAPSTVDVHRRNIMRKIGLHKVADLTRFAIRHHMISL